MPSRHSTDTTTATRRNAEKGDHNPMAQRHRTSECSDTMEQIDPPHLGWYAKKLCGGGVLACPVQSTAGGRPGTGRQGACACVWGVSGRLWAYSLPYCPCNDSSHTRNITRRLRWKSALILKGNGEGYCFRYHVPSLTPTRRPQTTQCRPLSLCHSSHTCPSAQ